MCGHRCAALAFARLVTPVRSNTGLRRTMHIGATNLDLNTLAKSAEQQRVQRLVPVGLRYSDIVLELTRHRLIGIVNHTQRPVTIIHRAHDDTNRKNIAHLGHGHPARAHLAINTVDIFLSAFHRSLETHFLQF